MGGYGSGRYGSGRKAFVEESLRLSLRELVRRGALRPGRLTPVLWRSPSTGECVGKVHILALPDRLRLHFRARMDGGDWQPCRQTIELVRVRTNFGRRRLFRCPTCRRACQDLFDGRMRFECRKCRKLAFLSQHQPSWERAVEQMRALRRKLGDAQATVFDELPPRPPRMRWHTYERIVERERQLTERWLSGYAPNLDRIK